LCCRCTREAAVVVPAETSTKRRNPTEVQREKMTYILDEWRTVTLICQVHPARAVLFSQLRGDLFGGFERLGG
jgi:hypothetical protein